MSSSESTACFAGGSHIGSAVFCDGAGGPGFLQQRAPQHCGRCLMCYALDLDTQSVTKSEVHEVFSQVSMSLSWQLHEHLLGSMPFLGCNWFATADLHLLTQSLSVVSLMLM